MLMIGSIESSYTDFDFIQDKDGCVNIIVSLSSKVTSNLKNEVAMIMI